MPVARFQVEVPFAPDLPENVVVSTFHLNDAYPFNEWPGSTDWAALAADAAAAWESGWIGTAPLQKITVKVYGVTGPPPHDPIATHVRNPAAGKPTPNHPTQLALCLSYKGGPRPWQRGRIYLAPWQSDVFGSGSPGYRPSTAIRARAIQLADALANLGGVDIDWSVFSRTKQAPYAVQEAWCDDSWDIQRRRKLDPTARTTKAYSE